MECDFYPMKGPIFFSVECISYFIKTVENGGQTAAFHQTQIFLIMYLSQQPRAHSTGNYFLLVMSPNCQQIGSTQYIHSCMYMAHLLGRVIFLPWNLIWPSDLL